MIPKCTGIFLRLIYSHLFGYSNKLICFCYIYVYHANEIHNSITDAKYFESWTEVEAAARLQRGFFCPNASLSQYFIAMNAEMSKTPDVI